MGNDSSSSAASTTNEDQLAADPAAAPALLCPCAGPVAEQVLLLENIATSIKTGPNQLPTIHNLLLEAVSLLAGQQTCMCSVWQQRLG
jgi:hypothetical protein